jgi:hypothetical protein
VVDWVAAHGPWDDSLAFVFDGGILTEDVRAAIQLADGELHAYRFVRQVEAGRFLRPYVVSRLNEALTAAESGTVAYLHNGRPR